MATMKDVAREAGVALGTVSRYINGESVKDSNREAIENAIKKLGYVQNPIAKTMKTGKSMTVGVLVPALSNMFSMRIIESVEKYLESFGYSVIVSSSHNSESEQSKKLRMFKNKMVDGIVLMPCSQNSKKIVESTGNIPLVLIDRLLDKNIFDSVIVSNRETVRSNISELINMGYKRFGIIEGPDSVYTARQRRLGYDDALREAGFESVFRESGNYTVESGYTVAKELTSTELDVLFTSNHELTVGVLKAYSSFEKPPILLGFDSPEPLLPQNSRFIMQPVETIGTRAAELIYGRMCGKVGEAENIVISLADCTHITNEDQ
ncbi:MAG: LacI family DNA-binding transcriptional regulator [Clostridia bacterium]|nr:LacI family DNA-binding transcriptional regulator [Clostridia bacterium]